MVGTRQPDSQKAQEGLALYAWELRQAEAMLAAFESVEVERFELTLVAVNGGGVGYRPRLTGKGLRRMLNSLFVRATGEHLNIIIRPRFGRDSRLVQLDDLDRARVDRVGGYGFLTLETSPNNFQVWIAVGSSDSEFGRRLRRGVQSDMGASGAVRLAGSINFKTVYAPDYPRVRVVSASIERPYANVEHLERAGILAPAFDPQQALRSVRVDRPPNAWPDYQRCVSNAPVAGHGAADISRADYTWAKIALEKFRWIQQPERVVEKLLEISPKASEKGESEGLAYCQMTVQNALRASLEPSERRGERRPQNLGSRF